MIQTIIIIAVLVSIAIIFTPPHTLKVNNNNSTDFIFSLDFTHCLRGAAILMVMVGHVSGMMNTVLFSPLGGTGVALFLLLSGFGLNESFKKQELICYWRKKVLRVLLPYFLIASLLYLIRWDFTWQDYLLDVIGIKTHYWYIAFLVKWYVAFWITSKYCLRYRTLLLLALSIVILFLFPNIEAEQAFSFPLGMLISIHLGKVKNLRVKNVIIIACILFVVGTIFLLIKQHPIVRAQMSTWIYNVVQLFIKLPYAMFIVCLLRLFPQCIKSKFLLFSGILCYELYLVHMPFWNYVENTVWSGLLLFLVSFAISYPFYLLNNKIKDLMSFTK